MNSIFKKNGLKTLSYVKKKWNIAFHVIQHTWDKSEIKLEIGGRLYFLSKFESFFVSISPKLNFSSSIFGWSTSWKIYPLPNPVTFLKIMSFLETIRQTIKVVEPDKICTTLKNYKNYSSLTVCYKGLGNQWESLSEGMS